MRELRGNLHVHSDQSDGTLPVLDIARVAAQCKLDFVGVNDHHVLCSESQYLSGVLFLMGTELNSQHSHYLAYNTRAAFEKKQNKGAWVIDEVKKKGGVGIIAHPYEKGSPIVSNGKYYSWQDWNVRGYDGIELWNQTSQWRDAATSYPAALGMWLFNRHRPFFRGACPDALAKWDEVCKISHVTGVAGSDLHAPVLGEFCGLKLKVLDYPMLFSAVNNYVIAEKSGDSALDSVGLIRAITQGKCWFTLDRLDLGYGFSFLASTGNQQIEMGSTMEDKGATWILVRSPRRGQITLLHHGKPVSVIVGSKLEFFATKKGVYRVEVRLRSRGRWIPWIYSNPLYIK